jgi:hypothetical protein
LALPVRMGVHTGEAEQRDGDWFGVELTVVARVMDAGHRGQVLCSAAAALLPAEFERRSLGEYRLKGLDREQTIFQIGPGRFPPLRAGASMVELPERHTSLLGRTELLARVDAALDQLAVRLRPILTRAQAAEACCVVSVSTTPRSRRRPTWRCSG